MNRIFQKLSRVTSSGLIIPEIDGLRFVAITVVMVLHIVNHQQMISGFSLRSEGPVGRLFQEVMDTGRFGVALFFSISGFVLSLPFARHHLHNEKKPGLYAYFRRRLLRIEPPYLINIVVCYALLVFYWHVSASPLFPHFIASLFYSHNILFISASSINQVAWTLEIEVQFYILAPFITALFLVKNVPFRRSLLLVLIVSFAVLSTRLPFGAKISLIGNVQYFLAGLLAVDFYCNEWSKPAQYRSMWDFAGLFSAIAVIFCYFRYPILIPFLITLLFGAVFRGTCMKFIFRQKVITAIGCLCYTLYLYHLLLVGISGKILSCFGSGNPWFDLAAKSIISLVFCIIAGAVIFLLLEKPFMYPDWPRRLVKKIVRYRP
jgi:peptidoglycan/LPS O-acetylase OafA/YrhL